jgi:hypothetical protein
MQFLGRWVAQVRSSQPAQRSYRIYRDCPLDIARARCLWHAGGTAGENDVVRTWRRRLPACPEGNTRPWRRTASWAEPGRLTAARWGDSNSTAPAFSIRDQGAVSPATCGSCDRLLTARARCCPRFADRPRTQHGPAPVRGGRLSVLWSWTPWARRSSATSSGAGRSVSRRLASPPLLPACSDRSRAVHMSRSTACTRPRRCNLNNARLSGWQSTWQSA